MCGGSCSQKPRTRVRTGGAVSPRSAGSASRVAVSTNASVRPSLSSAKNSPTTRSRLRRSVLAGRKGRASHRHRSGLKIPARPLSAPASPAVGGSRPLLHWPASPLEERAGVPALDSATRPSVILLTPQSRLRASSVTCSSACRSYSLPSSGWPTGSLHHKRHSMRSQDKLECGVQSVRCEARTALISPRTDSTPLQFSAPGTGAQ